jgi:hypothetical protein
MCNTIDIHGGITDNMVSMCNKSLASNKAVYTQWITKQPGLTLMK